MRLYCSTSRGNLDSHIRYIQWMMYSVEDIYSVADIFIEWHIRWWICSVHENVLGMRVYKVRWEFMTFRPSLNIFLVDIFQRSSIWLPRKLASLSGWFPLFSFTILCRYGGFSSFTDEWHLVILHFVNFGTKQPFIMAVMRW